MNPNGLTINESNQIVGIGAHDAALREFHLGSDNRFEICFSTPADLAKRLIFRGVSQLGFHGFTSGMILAEVYSWRLDALIEKVDGTSGEALGVLFGGNYQEKDLPVMMERILKKSPSTLLVLIESSFGGSIALTCEGIQIQ